MTIATAFDRLQQQLATIYDTAEALNIADWVMESLCGQRRSQWLLQKDKELDGKAMETLERYTAELLQHRPVQYVLGESYFYDLKLFVDERVLIPRPETEELADWILKYARGRKLQAPMVLDIGTGSGCLALSLKKHIANAAVYAVDISEGALAVAGHNANTLGLDIHLLRADILTASGWETVPNPDIIVSNPPYITLPEQDTILPNVLQYEPHQALFVTDNDPLQFYKAIERYAAQRLKPEGSVFLELHRDFAVATQAYYEQQGWQTELRKDMQGAERMLHCHR